MVESRAEKIIYENADFSNPEIMERQSYKHRRSPIIVTLDDPKMAHVDIQKLLEAGMNVIRLKTSFCTVGEQMRLIAKVDKATNFLCTKYSVSDWPVATCVELKTSIVRTGLLEGGENSIHIKEGTELVLTTDLAELNHCTNSKIFVDNLYLTKEVKVDMMLSISQDEIMVQCVKIIDDKSIKCKVIKGGNLRNMCLVCMRGGNKTGPLVTSKDYQIIKFVLEYQIDIIIINYPRKVETVTRVKRFIGKKVRRPIILVGICTEEGLKNVDDLIREADGIIFAREFLTYELEESSQHRLLAMQKWVNAKCLQVGKPFYISGGIFKQALAEGKFYQNESVDVTNAILDGATGFILKDCTDTENTLGVLKTLNELCCTVEPLTNTKIGFWRNVEGMQMPINAAQACAISCAVVAHQNRSRVIILPTVTGDTAKILMWLRPACLVLTVSTKQATTRRLQSYRCVVPLMFKGGVYKDWYTATNARVEFALEHALKLGWLEGGDSYVTLQRGSEDSAFCDTVRAWNVPKVKSNWPLYGDGDS